MITRGYDRLVNLSDAVIAIAVTLLILPLVDAATDIGSVSPGRFLVDHGEQLFLFVLSFVVIADFWVVHHRMYRSIDGFTLPLVWANFVWLLTIVFLPFPTELLGSASGSDVLTTGLYIGTMLVNTYAGLAQRIIIERTPELHVAGESRDGAVRAALIAAGAMTLAFVLAVFVPGVGLWALLVLLPAGWIQRGLIGRRRRHRSENVAP